MSISKIKDSSGVEHDIAASVLNSELKLGAEDNIKFIQVITKDVSGIGKVLALTDGTTLGKTVLNNICSNENDRIVLWLRSPYTNPAIYFTNVHKSLMPESLYFYSLGFLINSHADYPSYRFYNYISDNTIFLDCIEQSYSMLRYKYKNDYYYRNNDNNTSIVEYASYSQTAYHSKYARLATDANALGGYSSEHFLNYNNLTNKPISQKLIDLTADASTHFELPKSGGTATFYFGEVIISYEDGDVNGNGRSYIFSFSCPDAEDNGGGCWAALSNLDDDILLQAKAAIFDSHNGYSIKKFMDGDIEVEGIYLLISDSDYHIVIDQGVSYEYLSEDSEGHYPDQNVYQYNHLILITYNTEENIWNLDLII